MNTERNRVILAKLRQAIGALSSLETTDRGADIAGINTEAPLIPTSIYQNRKYLPGKNTWSDVPADHLDFDTDQGVLLAALVGLTTEKIILPSKSDVTVVFQVGRYKLSVLRRGLIWGQMLFAGPAFFYEEYVPISHVTKLLAPK